MSTVFVAARYQKQNRVFHNYFFRFVAMCYIKHVADINYKLGVGEEL